MLRIIRKMRNRISKIKKERVFAMPFNEGKSFFGKQIVCIILVCVSSVAEQNDLVVFPKIMRIIKMGLVLTQMSVPVVESLVVGNPPRSPDCPATIFRFLRSCSLPA